MYSVRRRLAASAGRIVQWHLCCVYYTRRHVDIFPCNSSQTVGPPLPSRLLLLPLLLPAELFSPVLFFSVSLLSSICSVALPLSLSCVCVFECGRALWDGRDGKLRLAARGTGVQRNSYDRCTPTRAKPNDVAPIEIKHKTAAESSRSKSSEL